jgi:DNA-binding PadR family transcriptional regulator
MMAVSTVRLTSTSYVVLGLLERLGPATPYDLKRAAQLGVSNFWSLPHAQLYVEPAHLAAAGLLSERQEQGGRRRKRYTLTDRGRRALDEWRTTPTAEPTELRDPGLLKLFFGAPPGPLAEAQLQAHRAQLDSYKKRPTDLSQGVRLALQAGIGHEREWTRFWARVANEAQR